MFKEIFEKFTDIGKLSDKELQKGQKITEGFTEVSSSVFFNVVTKIRKNDIAKKDQSKGLDTLTVYNKQEYSKMKCYIGQNNSSGYCINAGDLVSVFSSQQSSGNAIVKSAIENGAKTLDCFAELNNGKVSGQLYSLYNRHGFKINKNLTTGEKGVPYTIQHGISLFVNSKEEVELNNPQVVIFMKR